MPDIVVTYKKKAVFRRQLHDIAKVLYTKVCRQDLIWTENLNVYMREIGKFDLQPYDFVVHIAVDPRYHCATLEQELHVKEVITAMIQERVPTASVYVDILTSPTVTSLLT